MCYKITQYAEYACGHQTVVRKQVVDCHGRNCRFSSSHVTGAHNCKYACAQAMLPDQGLIMDQFNASCGQCSAEWGN